jgi:DNA-binding XRE family transcriptional regulator
MAKNEFIMNFNGPVGEPIDTVNEMTVNIGSDGTVTKDKGDNTAAKEIGKKLKMLKVERGLTSAAVCERAGIKAPTLTAIENGYYNVGIRQITEVAAALGAHIEIVKNEQ